MSQLTRRGALLAALACLISGTFACTAFASSSGIRFRPRVGNALGLAPPVGHHNFEPSEFGLSAPATYHGGKTMTGGVTVHTVFWAAPGYAFQGAPPGSKSYVGLIEQYFSDLDAASTGTLGAPCTPAACNAFTVEPQYGSGTRPGAITPGSNRIKYQPASDAVIDKDRYHSQCSSPQDTRACVTDGQVQAEVDKLIQSTPGHPRGLHNLWYVFLPPNVDECMGINDCDSTAFGGYHSVSDLGHGVNIYAVTGDPIIEFGGVGPGTDPQGNPDAEVALDVAAHETNEAISDPEGTGYVDPNGFEIGDKCEFGDQKGKPLGYAPDGSPYNQVVNGHEYDLQEMWSTANRGCVQATRKTAAPLPLPQVNLTQFSSRVTGNTENNQAGIHVVVKLNRAGANGGAVTVASGSGTTAGDGSWSATLSGGHTVGDDRDQIVVRYAGPGAPRNDVILTGNGGNPFTESGWTGWTALDEGSALTNFDPALGGPSLSIGPCFQAGVLTYSGASGPEPTTPFCGTASDVADTPLNSPLGPGAHVRVSSNDNRAYAPNLIGPSNLTGAMVRLTVPVGEPDAAPNFPGQLPGYLPTGFPVCQADLGAQRVTCTGLVPFRAYTLSDHAQTVHGQADLAGTLSEPMTVKRRGKVRLSNAATTLSILRVARLQVHLVGAGSHVARGTCTPGEYWAGPLARAPTSQFAGTPSFIFGGGALTGRICPPSGSAAGLPVTGRIAQTDERSAGETVTEVAGVANTSPLEGETLYGHFRALAQASAGRPRIALRITRGGGRPVYRAANVDTHKGVEVTGLKPGNYSATWIVYSRDGDTRTVSTRFIVQPPPGHGHSRSGA